MKTIKKKINDRKRIKLLNKFYKVLSKAVFTEVINIIKNDVK